MSIELTWKDNAEGEKEQRIYVGKNSLLADATLLKTVPANETKATVDLPATHAPAWLTVTAASDALESVPESFYVNSNGAFNPTALADLRKGFEKSGLVRKKPIVAPVTPDFDNGFGGWNSVHVLGNGNLLAIFNKGISFDLVTYDAKSFMEIKRRNITRVPSVYGIVGGDGLLYLPTANGNKFVVMCFDGADKVLDAGAIESADFTDSGVFLSDEGNPRFFGTDGVDTHWFMEVDTAIYDIKRVAIRNPTYDASLTTGVDGYNMKLALVDNDHVVFVRAQVQGSDYKQIVTLVDQKNGSQQQKFTNGFNDLNKSQLVVIEGGVQFYCGRNRALVSAYWISHNTINDSVSAFANAALVRSYTGDTVHVIDGAGGVTAVFYDGQGESQDALSTVMFPGETVGTEYSLQRIAGGILFFDKEKKKACVLSDFVSGLSVEPRLTGIAVNGGGMNSYEAGRNGGIKLS